MAAPDRLGAQVGSINAGSDGAADAANNPGPIAGVGASASSSSFGLYVPPAAPAGTFKLSMTFPSTTPAIGGLTFHSGAIDVATWGVAPSGARATAIETSLNTPVAPGPPPDGGSFGNLGGGVSVFPLTLNTFVISFAATALANVPFRRSAR